MMPPTKQFLLILPVFLLLLAASATHVPAAGSDDPPAPTPWPDQYHAVLLTNRTERGGRLQVIDLFYDWPRGRTLSVFRGQLSDAALYSVVWTNGSSFLFDGYRASASCTASWQPLTMLPPDWILKDDVDYLGRDTVDGFDCHVWNQSFFQRYHIDVATGRPVFWEFNGSLRHVLRFEVGGVPEENSSKWQAPASCFTGGNGNASIGGVDALTATEETAPM